MNEGTIGTTSAVKIPKYPENNLILEEFSQKPVNSEFAGNKHAIWREMNKILWDMISIMFESKHIYLKYVTSEHLVK